MATKKRAATTESKKKSTKRGTAAKTGLSRSGLPTKHLTKRERLISAGIDASGHLVKVLPGKFKVVEIPIKGKGKVAGVVDITKGDQAKGSKKKASTPPGASSTAPVVYQTLRERAAAVEKNIGKTQSLKDFLDSAGWR